MAFSVTARAGVVETETNPYAGVRHIVRIADGVDGGPSIAHVLIIELTSTELELVATAEADKGMTTGDWAVSQAVQVAVNGDLFDPFTFQPDGLAYGGVPGATWTGTTDDAVEGVLKFDRAGGTNQAYIEAPEMIDTDITPAITGVVSGRPLLVNAGAGETIFDCDDALTFPCERGPRTAVGLSMDGFQMIIAVVDGWSESSQGMTAAELADVMAGYGAYRALALDGGSAATMYVKNEGGVVNEPSDGIARVCANHLGISFTAKPPGTMLGKVFDQVFNGPVIVGASVTLDDGSYVLTDDTGLFSFSGLTPRWTCATADAAGYHPATQCKLVPEGDSIYNSIVLYPDDMFPDADDTPDAAPEDAFVPPADAATGGDGNAAVDGGELPPPGGTCGCRVGGATETSGPSLALLVWACAALAFRAMLSRRAKRDL